MTDKFKEALECIASGFPGMEFYGSSEQVEECERVARLVLGWHWHVTFKDWRDSDVKAQLRDGTPTTAVLHKDIGIPLYDDMPALFMNEHEAKDYARNIMSDAVHCASMSRERQEDLMAARKKGGILLPRTPRLLSTAEARAWVDAKVVDCRDPECKSFEVMRKRKEAAERLDAMHRDATEKKAAQDAEDERLWREGKREKVR